MSKYFYLNILFNLVIFLFYLESSTICPTSYRII